MLPTAFPAVVVQATLGMAGAIIAEAALSFLGLGVQPPTPSWGTMLDAGRSHLFDAPHLTIFPGLAIALLVLGFNFLGDGLRDRIDPKTVDVPRAFADGEARARCSEKRTFTRGLSRIFAGHALFHQGALLRSCAALACNKSMKPKSSPPSFNPLRPSDPAARAPLLVNAAPKAHRRRPRFPKASDRSAPARVGVVRSARAQRS